MKKLITLTVLIITATFTMPSLAVVDSAQLLSEDYLRNQGYSPESIRMINLRIVDPYAPHQEKEVKNTPVSWLKRFWQYADPAVDNERFGEGVINPSIDRPSGL